MSDFENGCAGSCDACGSKSDCEKATVTLTLDDGSMMECAILTIFEADEKEYIALLPLDEKGNASEEGDFSMYPTIWKPSAHFVTAALSWKKDILFLTANRKRRLQNIWEMLCR